MKRRHRKGTEGQERVPRRTKPGRSPRACGRGLASKLGWEWGDDPGIVSSTGSLLEGKHSVHKHFSLAAVGVMKGRRQGSGDR